MIPWWYVPIAVVATFILTYSLHGTWKLIIRKAKAELLKDFADIRARIDLLYEKAEGDIKAELGRIREQLKKAGL